MRHFGDFQTPDALATSIAQLLMPRGPYSAVLEPTCGTGAFVAAACAVLAPPKVTGVELQPGYVRHPRHASYPSTCAVEILEGDIYEFDVESWASSHAQGRLLILGNPPWVTNSELGTLGRGNTPQKSNLKGLAGLAAMTGESNFDIAEFIILRLAAAVSGRPATIAMLCKEVVAQNVLSYALDREWPLRGPEIRRIDARKWFDASVSACLFLFDVEPGTIWDGEVAVFDSLDASEPSTTSSYARGSLVHDSATYSSVASLEGHSPVEWRQGVKHDAAKVMVLSPEGGCWRNGLGEKVDVERDRVFPLLRGGPLQKRVWPPTQGVILTQSSVGETTSGLRVSNPKLWEYLERHADILDGRGSSIYRTQPRFAVFGIGSYTFSKYKVALASLYREPVALAIGPSDGRPVVFDDTCYMLPTGDDPAMAMVIAALLNHPAARSFLRSISSDKSKRVFTKKILQRLDWQQLAAELSWDDLLPLLPEAVLGAWPRDDSPLADAGLPLGIWLKERLAGDAPPQASLF